MKTVTKSVTDPDSGLFVKGDHKMISGVLSIIISELTVSAFGIKLSTLSKENGQARRTATMPQRTTESHFGAFFKSKRKSKTAESDRLVNLGGEF